MLNLIHPHLVPHQLVHVRRDSAPVHVHEHERRPRVSPRLTRVDGPCER
jgi:hypothetical protein